MKRLSLIAFLVLTLAASLLQAYPVYVRKLPVMGAAIMDSGRLYSGTYLQSIGKSSWLSSMLYANATSHSAQPISLSYDPNNPTIVNWSFTHGGGGGYLGDFFTFWVRQVDSTDQALINSDPRVKLTYEAVNPVSMSWDSRSTNPNPWIQLTDASDKPCIAMYGGNGSLFKNFRTASFGTFISPKTYDLMVSMYAGEHIVNILDIPPTFLYSNGKYAVYADPALKYNDMFYQALSPISPKGSAAYIAQYNSLMQSVGAQWQLDNSKQVWVMDPPPNKSWAKGQYVTVLGKLPSAWPPAYPAASALGFSGNFTVIPYTTTQNVVSGSFNINPSFLAPGVQYELVVESCNFQNTSQQGYAGSIAWQKIGLLGNSVPPAAKVFNVSAQAAPLDAYKVWFNPSTTISTAVTTP